MNRLAPSVRGWAIFVWAFFTVWLVVFFTQRYQGIDFHVYVMAGRAIFEKTLLYSESSYTPFRYAPAFAVLFAPWAAVFSEPALHVLHFALSVLCFVRISYLLFRWYVTQFPSAGTREQCFVLFLPWVLSLQALGTQIETGNINLLLMYALFEGFHQVCFGSGPVWAWVLLFLPVLTKPQMGCFPVLLLISRPALFSKKMFIGMGIVLALALTPFFFFPFSEASEWHRQWFAVNGQHADALLTNKITGGTLSLYSFFYHVLSLQIWKVNIFYFTPLVIVAFLGSFLSRSPFVALCLGCFLVFCVAPISFLFTLLFLLPPAVFAFGLALRKGSSRWYWGPPLLFAMVCCFGSYTVLGERVFNDVVVYYRLHAWFSLPLLFSVWKLRARHSSLA